MLDSDFAAGFGLQLAVPLGTLGLTVLSTWEDWRLIVVDSAEEDYQVGKVGQARTEKAV